MKPKPQILARLIAFGAALLTTLHATELYVAATGNDADSGSLEKPLRTIQAALDRLKAGDTCILRGGTYRERAEFKTSGAPHRPVRLQAYNGETVVLDGTETIQGRWRRYQGSIYQIQAPKGIEQLFVGREMMIEARWPNMRRDQAFDRNCWAKTDMGSGHGRHDF
jgi:hypothetical protein